MLQKYIIQERVQKIWLVIKLKNDTNN